MGYDEGCKAQKGADMKIAMTGASGFVANALRKVFPDVVSIERGDGVEDILKKLDGVYAVFNLAGAPIAKRWDEEYKKVLYKSRIETTKKVVQAINKSNIEHFISTSAVGVYPNDIACDETTNRLSDDFLAHIVKDWEKEALACNKKTTILRFGVVFGKDGGALSAMLPAFKFGFGGTIGDGSMVVSWIDINDLCKIYQFVLQNKLSGIFNATSPKPVTNLVLTKTLGKLLNRPTLFPLPKFLVKLIFSQGASVLLDSKEVYPKALLENGFKFEYPNIEMSLRNILF